MMKNLAHILVVAFGLMLSCAGLVCQPQLKVYGTVAATGLPSKPVTAPMLSVVGQTANARVLSDSMQPLVGIDYIRVFGLYGTDVQVSLANLDIPVSDTVRIPVLVTSRTTMNGVKTVSGSVQFTYRCELIDLWGVNEKPVEDGQCVASLPFTVNVNTTDTLYINGVSKLCSITSTALSGLKAAGIAEKGLTRVSVNNGELRQTGHCITDGTTRLILKAVNLSVYPQPATSRASIGMSSLGGHSGVINVYDLNGNAVGRMLVAPQPKGLVAQDLDVSGLTNGTYTVQYVYDSGVSSVSMVIQR